MAEKRKTILGFQRQRQRLVSKLRYVDSSGTISRLIGSKVVSDRGQRAEARRTTILHPVDQKQHSQKHRQNEKAEGYVSNEGKR